MSRLPDYLKFSTNGAPLADSVVISGDVRITVITPRLIRLEQGAWTDSASMTVLSRSFCPCKLEVKRDRDAVTVETPYLQIVYREGERLASGLTIRSKQAPGFFWRYGQKPLHNLGGTVSTLDRVNGACELEDGVCSLDGFSFIEDGGTPLFDEDGWLIPREKTEDTYFFGYGHDYTACVQDFYRLTGKPKMLPAFVFGNWWSRYHAYSDREYLELMDRFQEEDVPLSVGIVDMDWHLTRGDDWKSHHDGWTGYTWNKALFPDYKAFIQALHDRGLKTALNLHPAKGIQSFESQYAAMADRMGINPETGETVPCDYLNPGFLAAYFDILHHPYEADGIDFWWMDWQQGCDYAKVMGERYQPNGLECVKPLWVLNHMHYLSAQREGKRGLIFSRFSGFGSQRYPIGFSGDTVISWESLDFQPYFTATASNIGYGWWSHDIGGHMDGVRDDEMTTRWIQLGVFSPVFRLHSTDSVFLGREPWRYNLRARAVMERYMRLRHRMFPYLYSMCRRDCQELIPLIRPMYHLYPENPEAYRVKNQYFFGSELMVAPITKKSDESDLAGVDAWFPEGKWIDAFNGYVYKGGQMIRLFRPLEEMPVFLKAGAIVPMQSHIPGSRRLGRAEQMEVYVAPGANGFFRLYEDDGETLDYLEGTWCETPMEFSWSEQEAVFRILPAEGAAELIPAERRWTVHFRGFRKNCRILGGESSYDPQTNTYTVTGLRSGSAVELVIRNPDGLLHDNSDSDAIFVDVLTRAQCSLREKNTMLQIFQGVKDAFDRGQDVRPHNAQTGSQPSLGGKVWELLKQIY